MPTVQRLSGLLHRCSSSWRIPVSQTVWALPWILLCWLFRRCFIYLFFCLLGLFGAVFVCSVTWWALFSLIETEWADRRGWGGSGTKKEGGTEHSKSIWVRYGKLHERIQHTIQQSCWLLGHSITFSVELYLRDYLGAMGLQVNSLKLPLSFDWQVICVVSSDDPMTD